MVYLRLMSSITSVTASSMTGAGTVIGTLGIFGILLIQIYFRVAFDWFVEMMKVPC